MTHTHTQTTVAMRTSKDLLFYTEDFPAVLRIQIHRIHVFLGFLDPDPDPLVRGMEPDPSISKKVRKTLISTVL
jgi:hypothetical protein